MTHPLRHVAHFDIAGGYRLRICFEDGLERLVDLEPVLWGELYGPLRNPELFRTVRLDPEFKTLVWANGADFDPSILHDWPDHERAWHALAAKWKAASEKLKAGALKD
jgi:hypothetical protein